ncbi:MAG TPA: cupin domain-containing protein [Longimicrobiales bacterium]|nr:cupin domain-containing protein [Longimicrobiales bacterium]
MTHAPVRHARWDDIALETVTDDITRRLFTGERMMIAHVYLKKGAIVPTHQHENEQLTYILDGALHFWIGAEDDPERQELDVRAGEVLYIPANVPHRAEALEDTFDVDVFDPPRQDWLEGTDTYFHRK